MAQQIIPGAQAVTEDFSRVGGFIAGCGQASLAVILGLWRGQPVTVAQVTALIQQSVNSGHSVTSSGVSTFADLQWLASQHGLQTSVGSGQNWLSTVLNNLKGGVPTELGVSNARAFGGSDSNVAGHYVTIVGRDTGNGNFIVSDPNTVASQKGQFVEYSASQIAAANPFGTLTPNGQPSGGGPGGNPVGGLLGVIGTGIGDILGASGVGNVAGAVGSVASGASSAVTSGVSAVLQGSVMVLERVGLFLLVLLAIGFGVLLLIWEPAKSAVGKAAKYAPDAAALAA